MLISATLVVTSFEQGRLQRVRKNLKATNIPLGPLWCGVTTVRRTANSVRFRNVAREILQ